MPICFYNYLAALYSTWGTKCFGGFSDKPMPSVNSYPVIGQQLTAERTFLTTTTWQTPGCFGICLEAISKIIFGRFWYIVAVKSSDFVAIAPLCLLNLNFFRSTYPQNRLKAIFEIASRFF